MGLPRRLGLIHKGNSGSRVSGTGKAESHWWVSKPRSKISRQHSNFQRGKNGQHMCKFRFRMIILSFVKVWTLAVHFLFVHRQCTTLLYWPAILYSNLSLSTKIGLPLLLFFRHRGNSGKSPSSVTDQAENTNYSKSFSLKSGPLKERNGWHLCILLLLTIIKSPPSTVWIRALQVGFLQRQWRKPLNFWSILYSNLSLSTKIGLPRLLFFMQSGNSGS